MGPVKRVLRTFPAERKKNVPFPASGGTIYLDVVDENNQLIEAGRTEGYESVTTNLEMVLQTMALRPSVVRHRFTQMGKQD